MSGISNPGLIVLSIALQTGALSVLFALKSSEISRWPLLMFCTSILICLVLWRRALKTQRGLAQLIENAERLRQRARLLPIAPEKPLARLDTLLQEIDKDMIEFQRKEHSLVNHAVDVICSISHSQTFQSVNPAALKAWGYAPSELVGRKFSDILLEEDKQHSLQFLFGAEKSLDTLNFENRVRRKNGSISHVLWSAHWSAADQALFCVAHDITARRNAEKLLEESEQRIRQIFEDMPVGLILSNSLGIIELSNPALDFMCQAAPRELIGKHIHVVLQDLVKTYAPPDYSRFSGTLTETVVYRKPGGIVPVHVSARELTMGGEKKFMLVLIDNTEQDKLEQLKQEFFAMASHDLRSPLASLLSALESVDSGAFGKLNKQGKELIARNLREVERLNKLVDELLDMKKMKAGKFVLEAEWIAVDAVMESAIIALDQFARQRQVIIKYEKTELYVYADSSLLIRVFVNLLSNAIKFSPPGGLIIVEAVAELQENKFSVKDSGRGVPLEYRERIFEQYEQVAPSDRRLHGTGLGLPICKMIVEQHGGRIWVESAPEKGSIFRFTIPAHDPAQ